MHTLLQAAIQYRQQGYSVIATDALKQSLMRWKDYQHGIASEKQLQHMFQQSAASCLAIVTGAVSGHLEVIDVDAKYDLSGQLFDKLMQGIKDKDAGLVAKLAIARTRSGGFHLIYRCAEISGNKILAKRPVTENEKQVHPKEKAKVLIETRGEGGYIIVAPSPGYHFIQHDLLQVPTITEHQRQSIFEIAKGFNQYSEQILVRQPYNRRSFEELSPLDDYNQRGDLIGLLQRHGWSVVRQTDKRTFFRRPGDTDKRSSGDYNHEMGLFSVFTTSAEFEPGRGYRPYAVYAVLECNGDFRKAVRELAKEGYGQPTSQEEKRKDYIQRR